MSSRFSMLLLFLGFLALVSSLFGGSAAPTAPANEQRVPNFTLQDPREQRAVSFADFKDRKAIVVIFLGTECPINNAFLPCLGRLHQEYSPRGVQFLGINANCQDTPER